MERQVTSLGELNTLAEEFVANLAQNPEGATVVALHGELGSGKTSFTQAVARSLGMNEHVTSPTFVIEKVYKLEGRVFERLIHIDTYRLDNSRELEVLGWDELVREPTNIIFIEWAERVQDLLPKRLIEFSFVYINETTRSVVMKGINYGKN